MIATFGGNDVVVAWGGDDLITGGAGDDVLSGGPGHDTYVFNLGDGVDTITDQALPGEGIRSRLVLASDHPIFRWAWGPCSFGSAPQVTPFI